MIDGKDLAVGFGIAIALEGALWAAFPGAMRRALAQLGAAPEGIVRAAALMALAGGVALVWIARSGA